MTTMEYPTVPNYIKLDKRSEVRLNRKRAAWNVVHHKFGEVTEDEFDRAFSLLNRCIRYALANYRLNTTETELNVNLPSRRRKAEQLWNRFKRLNEELAYYDVRMNGNIWPQVVDIDQDQNVDVCYLYDFND